jgi:hypothetical protein
MFSNIVLYIIIFNILFIILHFKINDSSKIYKKNVYIISNIPAGGAVKYLNDITLHYNKNKYIYIKSKKDLNCISLNKNDVLFIQHIINSDISLDDLINIDKNNCKTYMSIHDFQWLLGKNDFKDVSNSYLLPNNNILNSPNYKKIVKLFKSIDIIIHPSQFTLDIYKKFYQQNNFKLVSHNDYFINTNSIYIPSITNNIINIGNLSSFDEYKGKEYILDIMEKYKTYNNYTINFIIVGNNSPSYNESEYYEYIKKYNIHGLTYLNKWGETWCYSLTKALNTGLPIIYNNIGAFKERIHNKIQYFKAFDYEYDDIQKIYTSFENMLDFIIDNNGKYNNFYSNKEIIYNPFYDKLFN